MREPTRRVRAKGVTFTKGHLDMITSHEERLKAVEEICDNMSDVVDLLDNIKKLVKWWAPIIVTAAISSGIVSGRWGAFLHNLVAGGG